MLKSVRTYMLWMWMGALLTSTVGISVHRIYCYCLGQTTLSLFSSGEGNGCSEQISPPAASPCCDLNGESCCAKPADDPAATHRCTDTSVEVLQLKAEFLVDQPLDKTLDCPAWVEDLPLFRRYFKPLFCELAPAAQPIGPPPLSGRAICQRHQIFRI